MSRVLLLLLALATPTGSGPGGAGGSGGEPASALAALAGAVGAQLGAPPEGRNAVALRVEGAPPALAGPFTAALGAALAERGWVVTALAPAADPEEAARAAGGAWLLRISAGATPDQHDLVAVGEAIPVWRSFFLQGRPGLRPAPPRVVSARAVADAGAALLLRAPPGADRFVARRLARLPYRVLALAAGDGGGGDPVVLAVTLDAVHLLDARGRELAARPLDVAARRPVRLAAATAVVGDLGGGRLGVALAGATGGEVLARRGTRLERVATLPMAPLASGPGGTLFGAFAAGRGALQDLVAAGVDPAARPRTPRDLVAVAASPRPGRLAFGALDPTGRLELLGPALEPLGVLEGIGAGFALADLDGDSSLELVASLGTPGPTDRIRIIRLPFPPAAALSPNPTPTSTPTPASSSPPPLWESQVIDGPLTAGAAADLTGDGRDDVLLAAEVRGEDGGAATDLWLVTADPRGAP